MEDISPIKNLPNRTNLLRTFHFFIPSVLSAPISLYCSDIRFMNRQKDLANCVPIKTVLLGKTIDTNSKSQNHFNFFSNPKDIGLLQPFYNIFGSSNIIVPDIGKLLAESGKLRMLDNLLDELKDQGHRVLLYSQMTKMIDILEDFMWYRKYKYLRLDGSSKLSDRRDMVEDFQTKPEIFVFLLSTRAGGLGINLTAADTVIFYDSDWNPTMDQQAMDRAHRPGQTKQVTVYRLVTRNTVEEHILKRAKQKASMHHLVIAGGNFQQEANNERDEVVSVLLAADT